MSIDLDWTKLDGSLATFLVDVLNKQLSNVDRPSFIGPVEVTSLDFGSASPDVELVDMRDIFRDFLEDEDDDESDNGPVKVTEGADEDEGYEWVSRRAAGREESLAFQQLPPHLRFGHGGPMDLYASMPALRSPVALSASTSTGGQNGLWRSTPSMGGFPSMGSPAHTMPVYHRSPTPSTPFAPGPIRQSSSDEYRMDPPQPQSHAPETAHSEIPMQDPDSLTNSSIDSTDNPQKRGQNVPPEPTPPSNPHPNLQLHLYINWHSNLRITLTTSLLINYPSPMFMSLPIKLSVTGLVFTGEVAVAYEGERRRVHLCVLDDQDPYGPAAGKRADTSFGSMDDLTAAMGAAGLGTARTTEQESSTPITPSPPSDLDPDVDSPHHHPLHPLHHPLTHHGLHQSRTTPQKPHVPIGQRLLPSIYIESEIGQADKHVLKNVTRVERFIQDVIRKTVEEELVFPNFHTLILSDPTASTGT